MLLYISLALLVTVANVSTLPIITPDAERAIRSADSSEENEEMSSLEETIDSIYDRLGKLELKALVSRKTVLEKLLNDSDTNWAEDDLPTYVITKEEKIFFYENPKPVTEELMGRRTDSSAYSMESEESSPEIRDLITVAKKHTNNAPSWPVFLDRGKKHTRNSPGKRPSVREELDEEGWQDTKKRNELVESLQQELERNQPDLGQKVQEKIQEQSEGDMSEMINSLQRYVDLLKHETLS